MVQVRAIARRRGTPLTERKNQMSFFMFLVWVGVSCAVGSAASNRFNRSGLGWFLVSCLISPLIAGPLLLVVGPLKPLSPPSLDWRRINWSGQPPAPKVKPVLKPWSKLDTAIICGGAFTVVAFIGFLMMVH
jgi:hypothetical protein